MTGKHFLGITAVMIIFLALVSPAIAADGAAAGVNAGRAAMAIDAMNDNWYSPVLRQWLEADGSQALSAWHSFNMLEQLIDYTVLTGDNQYIPLIHAVAGNLQLSAQGVINGNDDCEWQAIAFLKYYELINPDPVYLFCVQEIFKELSHHFWDDSLRGGVYWDHDKTYKNAITNELFLVMATRLYMLTGDQQYWQWALREWQWFEQSGMINDQWLVNDGLDNTTGKNNGQTTWTYNQGVILGGLANMYVITKDRRYLEVANKIATAAIARLSRNGILAEPGTIDDSRKQFKGIFVRYLARLAAVQPDSGEAAQYRKFIENNAEAVWSGRGGDSLFSYYWHAPDSEYDAVRQSSAVDLFNAALAVELLTGKGDGR
ncbi:MAG: glycoside hydrolase family 76 protein [Negativicutes bacterium]|nr:glycoside hydrolase family 76 protein [Negativicutes bacterium]